MSTFANRLAPSGATDFDVPLFCTRCEKPLDASTAEPGLTVCDGCHAELEAEHRIWTPGRDHPVNGNGFTGW